MEPPRPLSRTVALAVTLALVSISGSVSPAAAKGRGLRTESAEYLAPNTGENFPVVGYMNFAHCDLKIGCGRFEAAKGEGSVSVEITDASGQTVYGYVYQDRTGDGYSDTGDNGPVCGKTARPVPISPDFPIVVFVGAHSSGIGRCDSVGLATTGTITVTFHRGKPAKVGRGFDTPPE